MSPSVIKGLARFAAVSLGVAIVLYLGVVAWAFTSQRQMQYAPIPYEDPPAVPGVPIQKVQIVTADGERLVAWWLPPRAGKPTFLFFNGNAAGLGVQSGRWRRIAGHGAGFLAIGYRGYSGSTGHPTEKGLHLDAEAAYGWLAERVPAGDIVVHGYSLGSGLAVRLASRHPCRALILEAPYSAAVDVAAGRMPYLPVGLLMQDKFESRRWIGQVRAPILILHGDRDSVIPFAQGERLFALAPQPKSFVRMRGSDHNTLVRDGLYDHVWPFLGLPDAPLGLAAR